MELAKEKRGHFWYLLFCPKRFFLNIWVLSQGIVYWIHYISKNITSCTFLLVFTIVESLQCILKATCCPIISINNPDGVELLVSWLQVLVICVNINLDIIFMILWIDYALVAWSLTQLCVIFCAATTSLPFV